MKRVALYARVSTKDQETEMQTAELLEYVARRGWKLYGEPYVDRGISGTKATRPALDRLMSDARRRKFDVVCVWRFDRFARSVSHLLSALEEFRGLGIDFVSLNESIDTSTPMGKMVFTVVGAVAELERSIICERVRAGVAKAKRSGKTLGRPKSVDRQRVKECLALGLSLQKTADKLGISKGSVAAVKKAG